MAPKRKVKKFILDFLKKMAPSLIQNFQHHSVISVHNILQITIISPLLFLKMLTAFKPAACIQVLFRLDFFMKQSDRGPYCFQYRLI